MENSCVTCSKEVGVEDRAMMCDLCEKWEHVECIRLGDRPTEALYTELVRCRTRSLVFLCTICRMKGSVMKRLVECEYQCARTNDERLASARQLELAHQQIAALKTELNQLTVERDELRVQCYRGQTSTYGTPSRQQQSNFSQRGNAQSRVAVSPIQMPELITEHSSESSDEDRQLPISPRSRGNKSTRPHPPGFKEIHTRVDKFSGNKGVDFNRWLEDFEEASEDCCWDDTTRAKWFSWFLTGPAKTTWQCSLKQEDKESWVKIKQVYLDQYGVHMNPRTAYQRCHELQYEQFGSVQGLVDAMREYQRMAPQKLKDETLESSLEQGTS